MKVAAALLLVAATLISSGQACTVWRAVKCATHINVHRCENACLTNGLDSNECISCFQTGATGDLYTECAECSSVFQALLGAVTFDDAQGQTCGAFNWLLCNSALVGCNSVCTPNTTQLRDIRCAICLSDNYGDCASCQAEIVMPELDSTALVELGGCSPWQWAKCAGTVAACAVACSTIDAPACISCMGESYNECKDCVGLSSVTETANPVQGCSVNDWLHCGGALYRCLDPCLENGIESPQCLQCMGSAGAECFRCLSDDDKSDIEQVQSVQLSRQLQLTGSAGTILASGLVVFMAAATIAKLLC